ncbi:MAG TPA: DUF481 domain-containing protein [Terriglobia bacterium]|nr:DUF481 domain-containing protein [Terriglobia bacterium]
MRLRILVLLITCFFASSLSLTADQLTLKNGDHLTGSIVSSDAKTLTLKTDYAGAVVIQWSTVEEITSSNPVYLTSKSGQVVVGTVSTTEGTFNVATKESGTVPVPKDTVTAIRSEDEQKAYEATVERLRHPHLLDFWSGNVVSGLALTRGNSDTSTFNLGMTAARTTEKDKISVYATSLYTKSKITGTCPIPAGATVAPASCSVTTASAVRGGTRYDFNLTPRTFAFGQLDLEHDRFQQLDLRTVLGGGLGFHAVKNDRTTFDLMGGGDFDHDAFTMGTAGVTGATGTTGLTRSQGEILVGESLLYKVSKSTALNEALQFFPNLSATGEYRFTFDSGVVTQLSKWLSWQVTYSDRFLSDPIPGVKENDVLVTTGLQVNFGHPTP